MTSLLDLDFMILERIDANNLKPVSRVTREWRSYIANNIKKMRQFRALEIRVFYCLGLSSDLHRIDVRFPALANKQESKPIRGVNMMVKYKPVTLNIRGYGETAMQEQMKNDIDALPSWWFKQITKVIIHLNDEYEAMFLSRFKHLSNVSVIIYNIDLFALFIEKAPQVDTFDIMRLEYTYSDFILEVLLTKSSIYPLEFPASSAKCYFSLSKIIHFIKNNRFTKLNQHLICIMSQVIGKEKDFTDWVQKYSTSFTCLALDHLHSDGIHYRKWNFAFRGEYFDVLIAGFDNY